MQPFVSKITATTASYDAMFSVCIQKLKSGQQQILDSGILTAKNFETREHVNGSSKKSDFCLAQ